MQPVAKNCRITDQQLADSVRRYRGGESLAEVAEVLPIKAQALKCLMKRRGVTIRQHFNKISSEMCVEAAQRYGHGESLRSIASALGVSHGCLRKRLVASGVEMRSRVRKGEESPWYSGGPRYEPSVHFQVRDAIVRGDLVRPECCSECGASPPRMRDGKSRIQGHHDDYNKPLEVRWLCQACHREWHRHNTPVEVTKGGAS